MKTSKATVNRKTKAILSSAATVLCRFASSCMVIDCINGTPPRSLIISSSSSPSMSSLPASCSPRGNKSASGAPASNAASSICASESAARFKCLRLRRCLSADPHDNRIFNMFQPCLAHLHQWWWWWYCQSSFSPSLSTIHIGRLLSLRRNLTAVRQRVRIRRSRWRVRMALTRAWNPKATPSKTTSRMRATARARLRMPPATKKQVKVRVPADVGRISPKP